MEVVYNHYPSDLHEIDRCLSAVKDICSQSELMDHSLEFPIIKEDEEALNFYSEYSKLFASLLHEEISFPRIWPISPYKGLATVVHDGGANFSPPILFSGSMEPALPRRMNDSADYCPQNGKYQ